MLALERATDVELIACLAVKKGLLMGCEWYKRGLCRHVILSLFATDARGDARP